MIDSRSLSDLNPYVAYLANKHIQECKKAGVDIVVISTYRDFEKQAQLYAQGRTTHGAVVTNAKPGYSVHQYKMAYDIAILNKDGKTINWSDICDTDNDGKKDYYEVAEIGKKLGLTWGGDFSTIHDTPHYEWTGGLTLTQLRNGVKPVTPFDKINLLLTQMINDGVNINKDYWFKIFAGQELANPEWSAIVLDRMINNINK
jgi:peptidoglycan LD-endopeptidase CwlK